MVDEGNYLICEVWSFRQENKIETGTRHSLILSTSPEVSEFLAAQYEILSSLNINLYTKTSKKFFPLYLLFSLSIHSFILFTSIY